MQTPAPEFPQGNVPPPWVAPFVAVLVLVCIGAWLLMPLIRAWAKRIETQGSAEGVSADELAQLREHVAELDLSALRVQELEERLEFAERLLAQRLDQPQMPLHRTPV